MKSYRSLGMVIAIVLLVFHVVPAASVPAVTDAGSRKPAPDFTLNDSAGAPIHLSAFKGRVVLLDFWATWCHGCLTEIPWYVEFQDRYKRGGLSAIGVSMDDDGWKSVKPFLAAHRLNYPVVIGNQDLATLFGGLPSMPVTLLLDRNGRIADLHVGMVDKDAFEKEIQALLQEPATNPTK